MLTQAFEEYVLIILLFITQQGMNTTINAINQF